MENKPPSKRSLGFQGEKLACDYIATRGYALVQKNYHMRWGEIDLVARDRETLVFIEVKYRRTRSFGTPLEAITHHKQRQLIRAAQFYLFQYPHPCPIRFDVLGITNIQRTELHYDYIEDAISV